MKKILVLSLVIVLFLGGVVGASSINGDYKGNPIVKVQVNGKTLTPEVPAQIIDGSTFLPLRAVSEALGSYVDWDGSTYTASILPSNPVARSIDQIASDGKSFNIEFVSYSASKEGHSTLTFFYNKNVGDNNNLNDYNYMLTQCPLTSAEMCKINDSSGVEVLVLVDDIRAFSRGEIDSTGLNQRMTVTRGSQPVQPTQPSQPTNSGGYTLNDALTELGVQSTSTPTLAMKDLAIELMEIRKTKKQSSYSVQNALRDLGIPEGSIPTLATLRQAVKLISLHD